MKVVSLTSSKKSNEELVDFLEQALADAKAGNYEDGAFAFSAPGGSVVTFFTSTHNQMMRIAAVSKLLHTLHVNSDLCSCNKDR